MENNKLPKTVEILVYQAKTGAIELRGDFNRETLWASLQQIAALFYTDKSGISRHLKNIYSSGELDKTSTVAKIATVQKEGGRRVSRYIEYYNLDAILSVGYRVNSKNATVFRQWATRTLREHILKGYTINRSRIAKNYGEFLRAVDSVKKLIPTGQIEGKEAKDLLELISAFAGTWFSLNAYDKASLPKAGLTRKAVDVTADELLSALHELKTNLVEKKEASALFGIERQKDSLASIVGNIFQSFGGKDLYATVEDKAAHFLYFVVKNRPFVDGNKRSGAFSFIWFLNKAGILNISRLNAEALTALTLLVAESKPADKDRMIGLILMLIRKQP